MTRLGEDEHGVWLARLGCPEALVVQATRAAARLRTAVAEQEPFASHTSPGSTGPAGDVSEDPGVMAARLRAVGRRVRFEAVPEAVRAWVVRTPAAVARPAGGR